MAGVMGTALNKLVANTRARDLGMATELQKWSAGSGAEGPPVFEGPVHEAAL